MVRLILVLFLCFWGWADSVADDGDELPDINKIVIRETDPAVLARIAFPDNPNKENLRSYVNAVLAASAGQNSWGTHDRQVLMLELVGEDNLDVLIDAMKPPQMDFYLNYAVASLATEKSKPLILRALFDKQNLVATVLKNHWEKDAASTLIAGIAKHDFRCKEWITAVAALQDPKTYADLRWYLINRANRTYTYKVINALPGMVITADVVKAAWRNCGMWEKPYFALIAVEYGEPDALALLVRMLGNTADKARRDELLQVIRTRSVLQGTEKDVQSQYAEVKDRLIFDDKNKRFVCPKQ